MHVEFDLLGAVKVAGMRAEVRLFPSGPASEHTWEAPTHILSYRLTPGTTHWTRAVSKRPREYVPLGPLAYRPPRAVWECKSNGRPILSVMSFFEDQTLPATKEGEREPIVMQDLSVMELMRLLHNEIRAPGFASTPMVESIGEILRIKLARRVSAPDRAPERSRLETTKLALVRDYIEAQKGRSPSVEDLAQLCNVSRRSLLRRFKAETGMTVVAYVAQVQLARAKALLAGSNMELKQVAHEAGFPTASQFSVAFKRATGMTPSAFRSVARGA